MTLTVVLRYAQMLGFCDFEHRNIDKMHAGGLQNNFKTYLIGLLTGTVTTARDP